MALKDFEEYLLFDEMTAENLYFILWLRSYTDLYQGISTDSQADKANDLQHRTSRAIRTFFDPLSPLALNLPQNITNPILSTPAPLHPTVFEPARKHVRELLDASLKAFVRRCCGNATRNRSWFSASFAALTVVLGILVVLGSVFIGWARAVRFVAYPLFILGFTGIFAGMHGLCMIIYTFADARQLYPYELAAAEESSTSIAPARATSVRPESGLSTAVDSTSALDLEEHRIGTPADEKDARLGISFTPAPDDDRMSDMLYYTASFIPGQDLSAAAPSSSGMTNTLASSVMMFDFDSLPMPRHKRISFDVHSRRKGRSSPTFGGLTSVLSPIMVRGQWEIAARSMIWSFIVSTALMAGLAAVPFAS